MESSTLYINYVTCPVFKLNEIFLLSSVVRELLLDSQNCMIIKLFRFFKVLIIEGLNTKLVQFIRMALLIHIEV